MIFSKAQTSNVIAVSLALLNRLGVKHTKTGVVEKIGEHPNFPSLAAVEDCLTNYYIASESFTATNIEETLRHIRLPCIAQTNTNNFLLIESITADTLCYSNEKYLNQAQPIPDFLKESTGIFLEAEANPQSIEPDYKANRLKELINQIKVPVLVGCLIIAIILSFVNNHTPTNVILLTAIKVIGVSVSILLLIQSIDANNPFVKNLCGLGGKKDSCNAILKSDAAKLTSWLSWSEVGFFYFAGSLLALLFIPESLPLLALLNLLALPYTVYSFTYQYRHKNWCVLCCTVQVILISEAIVFYSTGGLQPLTLDLTRYSFLPSAIIAFLLPFFIWSFLKPFFLQAAQQKTLQHQLIKFKYNRGLFDQALKNQFHYAIGDELMPVIFGNPKAETVITMVSNPFCGPCAKTHETLNRWLQERDDIQLKIIFTTANDDDDEKTKVAKHISALAVLKDVQLLENALNSWYAQTDKKYDNWAQQYPVAFNGEMNTLTQKQKEWCEEAKIEFTPTLLVNGYKLPEPYRLEDIKYLI